jgi:3-oxoacyl-[acyl-carrier-protein] synthase II
MNALKMSKKLRVVVTGLGSVAANGIGLIEFWSSLIAKKSGIGPITLFDASDLKSRIAGEVKSFDAAKHISPLFKSKRFARHTQFAIAAAQFSLHDAAFDYKNYTYETPLPIHLGVSTSAVEMIEAGINQLNERGPRSTSPYVVSSSPPQATASAIADQLGIPSQTSTFSTACPAGLDAVASVANLIRSGHSMIGIAGGADSPITRFTAAGFSAAGLISTRNDEPEKASRPFSSERNSGVLAEGAGIVFLENLEHALARGVCPYFEITGYASCMDTFRDKPGSGLEATMRNALNNAGKSIEDVDYICAHGAGYSAGDRIETEAIKAIFGDRAYRIPVSSIKGVTGNPLAAAGPLQLVACGLAFRNQLIPPTTNCDEPDPACDLDYVGDRARRVEIECAVINAHGVSGTNSSMVIERVKI